MAQTDDRDNKGVGYVYSLVKKAVLLIRNPFDNVVANFHFAHGKHGKFGDVDWTYPKDRYGFMMWCEDMDRQFNCEAETYFSTLISNFKST